MEVTASVSKGVFAFKRRQGKKRKNSPAVSASNYWKQSLGWDEGQEELMDITYKNYTKCWEITSGILKDIQDSIHTRVFQSLIEYIQQAGTRLTSPRHDRSGPRTLASVPAACLVTGMNMPDRDATFHSLVSLLRDAVTPLIARLHSKECGTVRAAMYKIIPQLMSGGSEGSMEEEVEEEEVAEEEEEEEVKISVKKVKRRQCTMSALAAWYKEQDWPGEGDAVSPKGMTSPQKPQHSSPSSSSSPRKARQSPRKTPYPTSPRAAAGMGQSPRKRMKLRGKGSGPPLVLILEDLESFPQQVLSDLVLICREYQKELPMVLVLGVATTPEKVHHSLSHDASACLAMEVFRAQPSTHYLNTVIEKVVMSPEVPFHLGGVGFKLLLDMFLYSNLSVETFIKGFKVCMLRHFMSHPSSFLCVPAPQRQEVLSAASDAQLEAVRQLPSFRAMVEKEQPKEQLMVLLDAEFTKQTFLFLLKQLEDWYVRFCVLVRVVNSLTCSLPGHPLGRQLREVLAVCLSRPLVETPEYKEAAKGLASISRKELLSVLQSVHDVLKRHNGEDAVLVYVLEHVEAFVSTASRLEQPREEQQQEEEEEETPKGRAARTDEFERLRVKVLKFFDEIFTSHVLPPSTQPLHEVFFFRSSRAVKSQLIGLPKPALNTALANPHHYLQCQCCYLDDDASLVTSLPDISIAFKLLQECGRHVNVYDWLQAFVSVVGRQREDEEEEEEEEELRRKMDDKLQARFVLAVSELKLLGFIKPTDRKTDHVVRLVCGGC